MSVCLIDLVSNPLCGQHLCAKGCVTYVWAMDFESTLKISNSNTDWGGNSLLVYFIWLCRNDVVLKENFISSNPQVIFLITRWLHAWLNFQRPILKDFTVAACFQLEQVAKEFFSPQCLVGVLVFR